MQRTFQEDLLNIGVSRLRATGLISPEMNEFVVRLGEVEQNVGVQHLRFPNGGGWSFFVAPCCCRRVRTLKLYASRLMCGRCLQAHGVLFRATPMKPWRRAELRIPKSRAMLESKEPLRLKPSTLWGTMEKRSRHEAALRKAEFRLAQGGIRGAGAKAERVEDPCDEADFKPPRRPWPRLKNR
jgi:hypothetical protein